MKYISRIYFVLVFSLVLVACSDDDNPSKNEDTGPKAIEGTVSWEFKTTDINHTIAIQLEINPTFDGESLTNGDKIGVFYDDNGAYKCGGYSVWNGLENIAISAWGDDGTTSEKDGFSVNGQFIFLVQRANDQKSYIAVVEFKEGDDYRNIYTPNGLAVLKSLKVE